MNGILGSSVNKIVNDTGSLINVALSWAVEARILLTKYHSYSPNQLVFGINPAIPNVYEGDLSVLENKTK